MKKTGPTVPSLFDDPQGQSLPAKRDEATEPLSTATGSNSSATASQPAGFQTIGALFNRYQLEDKGGYITQEYQDFGYRLAVTLNDMKHKSLYIKMAKSEKREILERALSFVADSQARSKARLFMWKVKELKKANQPPGSSPVKVAKKSSKRSKQTKKTKKSQKELEP